MVVHRIRWNDSEWELSRGKHWLEVESSLVAVRIPSWVSKPTQASLGVCCRITRDVMELRQSEPSAAILLHVDLKKQKKNREGSSGGGIRTLGLDYMFQVDGVLGNFVYSYRENDHIDEESSPDDSQEDSQEQLEPPESLTTPNQESENPFVGLSQLSTEDPSDSDGGDDEEEDDDTAVQNQPFYGGSWNPMTQEPELQELVLAKESETQPSLLEPKEVAKDDEHQKDPIQPTDSKQNGKVPIESNTNTTGRAESDGLDAVQDAMVPSEEGKELQSLSGSAGNCSNKQQPTSLPVETRTESQSSHRSNGPRLGEGFDSASEATGNRRSKRHRSKGQTQSIGKRAREEVPMLSNQGDELGVEDESVKISLVECGEDVRERKTNSSQTLEPQKADDESSQGTLSTTMCNAKKSDHVKVGPTKQAPELPNNLEASEISVVDEQHDPMRESQVSHSSTAPRLGEGYDSGGEDCPAIGESQHAPNLAHNKVDAPIASSQSDGINVLSVDDFGSQSSRQSQKDVPTRKKELELARLPSDIEPGSADGIQQAHAAPAPKANNDIASATSKTTSSNDKKMTTNSVENAQTKETCIPGEDSDEDTVALYEAARRSKRESRKSLPPVSELDEQDRMDAASPHNAASSPRLHSQTADDKAGPLDDTSQHNHAPLESVGSMQDTTVEPHGETQKKDKLSSGQDVLKLASDTVGTGLDDGDEMTVEPDGETQTEKKLSSCQDVLKLASDTVGTGDDDGDETTVEPDGETQTEKKLSSCQDVLKLASDTVGTGADDGDETTVEPDGETQTEKKLSSCQDVLKLASDTVGTGADDGDAKEPQGLPEEEEDTLLGPRQLETTVTEADTQTELNFRATPERQQEPAVSMGAVAEADSNTQTELNFRATSEDQQQPTVSRGAVNEVDSSTQTELDFQATPGDQQGLAVSGGAVTGADSKTQTELEFRGTPEDQQELVTDGQVSPQTNPMDLLAKCASSAHEVATHDTNAAAGPATQESSQPAKQANKRSGRKRRLETSPSNDRRPTRRKTGDQTEYAESQETAASASRVSKRKRAMKTKETPTDENKGEGMRIVVTGVKLTARHKKAIVDLGGTLVDSVADAHTATHIIATDGKSSMRRTPKLMIALCRTPHVLSLKWLVDSSKAHTFLPCDNYLVLQDKKAEAEYGFSLVETLEVIRLRTGEDQLLLSGWSVFVCSGVAGNKAPTKDELQLIVEAAGGVWVDRLTAKNSESATSALIITSDPESKKQISAKAIKDVLKNGAQKRTTAWLFHATFTQTCDLPSFHD